MLRESLRTAYSLLCNCICNLFYKHKQGFVLKWEMCSPDSEVHTVSKRVLFAVSDSGFGLWHPLWRVRQVGKGKCLQYNYSKNPLSETP